MVVVKLGIGWPAAGLPQRDHNMPYKVATRKSGCLCLRRTTSRVRHDLIDKTAPIKTIKYQNCLGKLN